MNRSRRLTAVQKDDPPIEAAMDAGKAALAASTETAMKIVPAAIEQFALRARAADRSPRVLIDGHCNILWRSSDAEQLLQPPLPLWIRSGRLHARQGGGAKAWPAFVENVGEEGERLLLNGSEPGAWVLLRGWSQRLGEHRVVFLKCSPSWPLRDVASSGLVQDFGLTRSECAVLDEFARLAKPLQIAERLNISISTVRSHLKQIHTKMAVNSSVQLIGITRAYTDD